MPDESTSTKHRFEFGKNWQHFLAALGPEQIEHAQRSLLAMLGGTDLAGTSFLDVGCGSGLSSLVARRLGARVHSFDFDRQSVACTRELKERYFPGDAAWTIEPGSVLDAEFVERLGKFDLVYAWGVLHHTGSLWLAMEMATIPLALSGRTLVAIYNYRPYRTEWHTAIKRTYVASPRAVRGLIAGGYLSLQTARGLLKDLALLRNPATRYRQYSRERGMSWWHDTLDWLGGYPFEAATSEAVIEFYQARGFVLEKTDIRGGHACNQYLWRRNKSHDASSDS